MAARHQRGGARPPHRRRSEAPVRVLNGERAMRADEFVRLCAVLGLGLGWFFPPGPSREPGSPGH